MRLFQPDIHPIDQRFIVMALEAAFPGTTVHCQRRPAQIADAVPGLLRRGRPSGTPRLAAGARRCPASRPPLAT
jgi:hypothetical protein